jgi:hypothetical protein
VVKDTHTRSWEEFEEIIAKFDDPSRSTWDEVWFRGQSDAKWGLLTTLERRVGSSQLVYDYLRLVNRIKPTIETFTGLSFDGLAYGELKKGCRRYDQFHSFFAATITYIAHFPRHSSIGRSHPMWRLISHLQTQPQGT